MIQEFLNKVTAWAQAESDVWALIVVGSCARGTNRQDSDIDLMVLGPNQMGYVNSHDFIHTLGRVTSASHEDWSACQSIRVYYADGPEVEYGFVMPSWLDLPLDPGTQGVLRDGYKFLVDKRGYAAIVEENL